VLGSRRVDGQIREASERAWRLLRGSGVFSFYVLVEHGRRPKRIEPLERARWTVKRARVAGERTKVSEYAVLGKPADRRSSLQG